MTQVVFITPLAELDIYDAALWYELKSAEFGKKFLSSLREKINLIKQNPLQFQKRFNRIQVALLNDFPYGIYFIKESSRVVIIAVLHFKRNPRTWKKRPKK